MFIKLAHKKGLDNFDWNVFLKWLESKKEYNQAVKRIIYSPDNNLIALSVASGAICFGF
jgi:hypothetical protein